MPVTQIRVEGGAKFRRTMKAAGVDLDDLKAKNARLSKYFAFRAAAFAPRRSGRLAASVRGAKARAKVSALAGRKTSPYAGPIHWGWPSRPNPAKKWRGGPIEAQPFLLQAAEVMQPFLLREWERGVQETLNKVQGAPR